MKVVVGIDLTVDNLNSHKYKSSKDTCQRAVLNNLRGPQKYQD